MSNLDAILKQYQNNTSNASKKMSSEDRLKQYFTTFLPDGVNSLTKKVRILPVGENETPFVEVMGHKAQVNGQWRTFICPKHEKDEDCPFCEARTALLATGDDNDKTLAKNYSARKMYVVKVIDRAHEDEGPKFWRFNHDYRKTGIFDKIFGVLQAISDSSAPNIMDVENGRDLIITIARDQNGRPTVNSIVQSDPSALHSDAETAQNWINDDKTWENVYSVKPYSYLEIIVKGGEPTWKKNASGEGGEWVDKNAMTDEPSDDAEEALTIGGNKPSTNDDSDEPSDDLNDSDSDSSEDDDDLPF